MTGEAMNKQEREARDAAVVNDFVNNVTKKDIALKHNVSITTINTVLKAHYWCHNKPRKRPKNVPTEKSFSVITSFSNVSRVKKPKVLRKVTKQKKRPSNRTAKKALSVIKSFNKGASVKSLALLHNVTRQRIYQYLKSGGIETTIQKKNVATDEAISYYLNNKTTKINVCKKFNITLRALNDNLNRNRPRSERTPSGEKKPSRLSDKAISVINSFNNGVSVKSLTQIHNLSRQRIHHILKSGGIKTTLEIKNLVTDEAISYYLNNKTSQLKVCEKFDLSFHSLNKYLRANEIKKSAYDSINHNLFIEYYVTRNYSLPKTAKLLGIHKNQADAYRSKFSITKGGKRPNMKSIPQEAIDLYLTTNITQPELAKMLDMTVTTLRTKLLSKGIKRPRHYPNKKTQ